jgi:hypothetical protein
MMQIANQAHARRADPQTSHDAARAATNDMTWIQNRILRYAQQCGREGFTDFEMYAHFEEFDSNYRSRRAELRDAGYIEDSAMRRRKDGKGRQFIVWRVTGKGRAAPIRGGK